MTIDRAKELLRTQIDFGSGYNRNAAKLILAEVQKEHGMAAYDRLVVELEIERHFGFRTGETMIV